MLLVYVVVEESNANANVSCVLLTQLDNVVVEESNGNDNVSGVPPHYLFTL